MEVTLQIFIFAKLHADIPRTADSKESVYFFCMHVAFIVNEIVINVLTYVAFQKSTNGLKFRTCGTSCCNKPFFFEFRLI